MASSVLMIFRVTYAVVGVVIGLSVFCVFGIHFHNWNAASWGLTSGLAALSALFVHVQNARGKWDENMRALRVWMLCGCFIQLAGVVGLAVYLALAVSQHQDLVIEGDGYYLTLVWCFMTWKWGFALLFYSRLYRLKIPVTYTLQS